MLQQESIYNIIPKSKLLNKRSISYRSIYPYFIKPTASTFNLHTTSYPNVINCSGEYKIPRGAHELNKQNATFGLPEGSYLPDPKNYHKKGQNYRILPPLEKLHPNDDKKKPPIPKANEHPLILIKKSNKNYIVANAIDNILMKPKLRRCASQSDELHKYYGKVPDYIKKFRLEHENELLNLKEEYRKKKEKEDEKQRLLSKEEVQLLREGLKKKWEIYNNKYEMIIHKRAFDNLVLLRK